MVPTACTTPEVGEEGGLQARHGPTRDVVGMVKAVLPSQRGKDQHGTPHRCPWATGVAPTASRFLVRHNYRTVWHARACPRCDRKGKDGAPTKPKSSVSCLMAEGMARDEKRAQLSDGIQKRCRIAMAVT
ncbi:hypothetical protein DCS_07607 [Drechmeria coniospora]|uniref:Uncharacterized protein n=1 Tax=Drechmeria coniospora TaxID=98403 RepID=A0A151GEY6_DRECN|nr:hypothetical protein DCS_07607 [Drechmeria coniospora]KYK55643.1 hypothetical protein DCS_07607 [Drechmeria coniospora]